MDIIKSISWKIRNFVEQPTATIEYKIAALLEKFLSGLTICKLASARISFYQRKLYNRHAPLAKTGERQVYTYICDGSLPHGGITDRFFGLLATYVYCKRHNCDFHIAWNQPFCLQDFLKPATFNWIEKPQDKIVNPKQVCIRDSYFVFYNLNDEAYEKFMHVNDKPFVHVYGTSQNLVSYYKQAFTELFVLANPLQTAIDNCLKELGNKYISISFRFLSLLGDFNEVCQGIIPWNNEQKEGNLNSCIEFIKRLHKNKPQYKKILIASDSVTFLSIAQELPYVYVVPGTITHTDNTTDGRFETHLKTFLDLLLISKAEEVYVYCIDGMRESRFPALGALIGGKKAHLVHGKTN